MSQRDPLQQRRGKGREREEHRMCGNSLRKGKVRLRGEGEGGRGQERQWSVFASFACEYQKFENSTVNAYIFSSAQLRKRINTIMLPVFEVELGSQTSENT